MTWLRRLAFIFLLIVLMVLAAMFAYSNPRPVDVDIGLFRVEQISMALAFAVVFICGWLFGRRLWQVGEERYQTRVRDPIEDEIPDRKSR